MSSTVLSKIMPVVKDHPTGTGHALLMTSGGTTVSSFVGFINENYQLLHLSLSALVAIAAIASYGLGHVEKRKQTKLIEKSVHNAELKD